MLNKSKMTGIKLLRQIASVVVDVTIATSLSYPPLNRGVGGVFNRGAGGVSNRGVGGGL